jgi:glycosyltransferase involved in cell wall biosynthesis
MACRNEVRHIRAILDSLASQDIAGLDCEFLIADGMSTDGTRRAIEEYAAGRTNIRVLDNPGRIVSTGLNAAIRESRGDIVIRMDAHTEYAPDYVRTCVGVLESTGADNVGGPARTKAEGLVQQAVATAYHSPFSCGGARFHDTCFEGRVDTVTYGCWRRTAFARFGLYDEQLVRNQDDEHNLRIVRAGGTIWQSPSIVSWYRPRSSVAALFRQYLQYGFWKVAVIRKHRVPASIRHLIPGLFVAALAVSALTALIGAAAGSSLAAWAGAAALALIASAYGVAALLASLLCEKPYGRGVIVLLPVVFAVYHISYGLGFLLGLLRSVLPQSGRGPGRFATEITR